MAATFQPHDLKALFHPRRPWLWLSIVFVLYCLAGFLLAPWLVERQVVKTLDQRLGFETTVERLAINPLTLTFTVEGFATGKPEQPATAALGRLFVDFELASLWRRAWAFDHIEVEGLHTEFVRYQNGGNNLARIARGWADTAPPAAEDPAPAEAEDGGPPRLLIQELIFTGGKLDIRDNTLEQPFRTTLELADFRVEYLATLPETEGDYALVIEADNGARTEVAGNLSLSPLTVSGEVDAAGPFLPLAHRYLRDHLAFDLPRGNLNLAADFRIAGGGSKGLSAGIENLQLEVADLALTDPAQDDEVVTIPSLTLTGGEMAWPEQRVALGEIAVKGATVDLSRNEQGQINLVRLARLDRGEAEPAQTESTGEPWQVVGQRFSLDNAAVVFRDAGTPEPAQIRIETLNAGLENFALASDHTMPVTSRLTMAAGGTAEFSGELRLLPQYRIEGNLKVSELSLKPAEPYLRQFLRIELTDGLARAEGEIVSSTAEPFSYSGGLAVTQLELRDPIQEERLAALREFQIESLRLSLAERRMLVGKTRLDRPYVRVEIDKDKSSNIGRLLVEPSAETGGDGDSDTQAPADKNSPGDTAPFVVAVEQFDVVDGRSDFTDLSLPLPFSSRLSELSGSASQFHSGQGDPARLTLDGRVGEYGQATVKGRTQPLSPLEQTDIELRLRNVDMPPLSPYLIDFAGRRIAEGKIDLDLNYRIDGSQLDGANNLVLHDFRLGERVDAPNARDLPLDLAVALLKDGDGTIRLNVPVKGDMGNPQFDISQVVANAVANLVTGIVTAPFRLLAGLVGADADEFDAVQFAPGRSDLTPPEEEKVHKLAEALAQRPSLVVSVPGVLAPEADREALKTQALDRLLQSKMEEEAPAPDRRRRVLEAIYRDRGLEPRLDVLRIFHTENTETGESLNLSSYNDSLRERLAQSQPLADNALAELAQARTATVMGALQARENLAADRIADTGKTVETEPDGDGLIPLPLDVGQAQSRRQ